MLPSLTQHVAQLLFDSVLGTPISSQAAGKTWLQPAKVAAEVKPLQGLQLMHKDAQRAQATAELVGTLWVAVPQLQEPLGLCFGCGLSLCLLLSILGCCLCFSRLPELQTESRPMP